MLRLYGYWRSSAAYRLRIAMNLKGLEYAQLPINIAPAASEQIGAEFQALNPQMRVPVLEADGELLTQSMAILEWLEETYPQIPLVPANKLSRARCRAFADIIACDVHPLNNLSVLSQLKDAFGAGPDQISDWYADWIRRGFFALEAMVQDKTTKFAYGEEPSFAEICLVPQIYNARRFDVDLSAFPTLVQLDAESMELEAFQRAVPEVQPDAS